MNYYLTYFTTSACVKKMINQNQPEMEDPLFGIRNLFEAFEAAAAEDEYPFHPVDYEEVDPFFWLRNFFFDENENENENENNKNKPKKEKKNYSICTGKPIFALPCNVKLEQCAVCLEDVSEIINITVTTCGHTFHSYCIFKCLESNTECPMCRNELVEPDEDEDEDLDEDEEDDGNEDDGNEDSETDSENNEGEENTTVTVEQLAEKIQSMGYTMADLIKVYLGGPYKIPSTNETRYNEEFEEKFDQEIDDILSGKIPIVVVE